MASNEEVRKVFAGWDMDKTEIMLEKLDVIKINRMADDAQRREYEIKQ